MCDVNVTTLTGRLTRDPDVRSGQSGVRYALFTVAASRRWKDDGNQREEMASVPCIAFGPSAERLAKHRKDERVVVSGRLRTDRWDTEGTVHSRLVLVAGEIQFVGQTSDPGAAQAAAGLGAESGVAAVREADKVPF